MTSEKTYPRMMSPGAYDDMKERLRALLQKWGIWTSAEISEVAELVELEILQDRLNRETVSLAALAPKESFKTTEYPPEFWLRAVASENTDRRLIEGFLRDQVVGRHYLELLERAFKK